MAIVKVPSSSGAQTWINPSHVVSISVVEKGGRGSVYISTIRGIDNKYRVDFDTNKQRIAILRALGAEDPT